MIPIPNYPIKGGSNPTPEEYQALQLRRMQRQQAQDLQEKLAALQLTTDQNYYRSRYDFENRPTTVGTPGYNGVSRFRTTPLPFEQTPIYSYLQGKAKLQHDQNQLLNEDEFGTPSEFDSTPIDNGGVKSGPSPKFAEGGETGGFPTSSGRNAFADGQFDGSYYNFSPYPKEDLGNGMYRVWTQNGWQLRGPDMTMKNTPYDQMMKGRGQDMKVPNPGLGANGIVTDGPNLLRRPSMVGPNKAVVPLTRQARPNTGSGSFIPKEQVLQALASLPTDLQQRLMENFDRMGLKLMADGGTTEGRSSSGDRRAFTQKPMQAIGGEAGPEFEFDTFADGGITQGRDPRFWSMKRKDDGYYYWTPKGDQIPAGRAGEIQMDEPVDFQGGSPLDYADYIDPKDLYPQMSSDMASFMHQQGPGFSAQARGENDSPYLNGQPIPPRFDMNSPRPTAEDQYFPIPSNVKEKAAAGYVSGLKKGPDGKITGMTDRGQVEFNPQTGEFQWPQDQIEIGQASNAAAEMPGISNIHRNQGGQIVGQGGQVGQAGDPNTNTSGQNWEMVWDPVKKSWTFGNAINGTASPSSGPQGTTSPAVPSGSGTGTGSNPGAVTPRTANNQTGNTQAGDDEGFIEVDGQKIPISVARGLLSDYTGGFHPTQDDSMRRTQGIKDGTISSTRTNYQNLNKMQMPGVGEFTSPNDGNKYRVSKDDQGNYSVWKFEHEGVTGGNPGLDSSAWSKQFSTSSIEDMKQRWALLMGGANPATETNPEMITPTPTDLRGKMELSPMFRQGMVNGVNNFVPPQKPAATTNAPSSQTTPLTPSAVNQSELSFEDGVAAVKNGEGQIDEKGVLTMKDGRQFQSQGDGKPFSPIVSSQTPDANPSPTPNTPDSQMAQSLRIESINGNEGVIRLNGKEYKAEWDGKSWQTPDDDPDSGVFHVKDGVLMQVKGERDGWIYGEGSDGKWYAYQEGKGWQEIEAPLQSPVTTGPARNQVPQPARNTAPARPSIPATPARSPSPPAQVPPRPSGGGGGGGGAFTVAGG